MNSAESWAKGAFSAKNAHRVMLQRPDALLFQEPGQLIQLLTQHIFLCGGPVEYFSKRMPTWNPPSPAEETLRPIDVLYGVYRPSDRSIEVFVNRIEQDAPMFDAHRDELATIVRLHEYAHAIVHCGVPAEAALGHLSNCEDGDSTAWPNFLRKRGNWFAAASEELHEFLAQAMCYSAVQALVSKDGKWARLPDVFDALEAKQPPHYQLLSVVKKAAATADWPLVLDAARGVFDPVREDGFQLLDAITTLVCANANGLPSKWIAEESRRDLPTGIENPLPDAATKLDNLLGDLQQRLAFVDLFEARPSNPPSGWMEILIAKRRHIKLQIYADIGTHRRPHFHISYKQEHAASYAIDDFSRLAGTMPRKYETPILDWAKPNQSYLRKAWEDVNSGCRPGVIDIERLEDENAP